LSVAALTALGLAWIPFIDLVSGQLFTYIQSVQAYVSPPIAAVFLVGVLWPRANASGAMTALLVGFVLGIGRLALEINATAAPGALAPLAMMNFLQFAILLFGVSVVVLIVVSLATRAPDRAAIAGLTLGGRRSEADPGRGLDIGLSCGLVLAVLAIWTAFSSFGFGAAHG